MFQKIFFFAEDGKAWISLAVRMASKEVVCSFNELKKSRRWRWWWWCWASTHFSGWLIQLWVCFFAIKTISSNCICFNRPRGISHLNFKCVSFWKSHCAHSWTSLNGNNTNMSIEHCKLCASIDASSDDKIWYKTANPFQQRLLLFLLFFI